MSKKLAAGSDRILLDVKWGNGAFMPTVPKAVKLANSMVAIGRHAGKPTRAMVTDMNQPLGNAVGNALEVIEAVEILKGDTIGDLKDLIIALSVEILVMGEIFSKHLDAEQAVANSISSGSAIIKLQEMIELHGGDPGICENLTILPKAKKIIPVCADSSGYIAGMETDLIGISTVMLGAGREKKSDAIDHAVGLWLKKRIGERVEKDETLAEFHINDTTNEQEAINLFLRSIHIGAEQPGQRPLIVETIG